MRRLLATTVIALGALSMGAMQHGAVLAAGNSDAAHACQQGGYLKLTRADGTGFKNVGDCVSYAAQGGVLTTPAAFNPHITVTQSPSGDGSFETIDVSGTGFHANGVSVNITANYTDSSLNASRTAITDSTGAFGPVEFFPPCTGVSGATVTVTATDAQGVTTLADPTTDLLTHRPRD